MRNALTSFMRSDYILYLIYGSEENLLEEQMKQIDCLPVAINLPQATSDKDYADGANYLMTKKQDARPKCQENNFSVIVEDHSADEPLNNRIELTAQALLELTILYRGGGQLWGQKIIKYYLSLSDDKNSLSMDKLAFKDAGLGKIAKLDKKLSSLLSTVQNRTPEMDDLLKIIDSRK